jgi:hypothetical protein
MSDLAPAATRLSACAHCGNLDAGTYCSACGKELSGAHKPVLVEAWEHMVVDRVNDLRDFATTTAAMLARPHRFFRTVLEGPAERGGHVFPEPVAAALSRGRLQTPVKYLILSVVAMFLASKLGGEGAEIFPGASGISEEVGTELFPLMLVVFLAVYGVGFRLASGKRVSVEEVAVFNAYLYGAVLLTVGAMAVTPESWMALLAVEVGVLIEAALVLPYLVLPRLYGLSKRRIFFAQMCGGFGANLIIQLPMLLLGVGDAGAAL